MQVIMNSLSSMLNYNCASTQYQPQYDKNPVKKIQKLTQEIYLLNLQNTQMRRQVQAMNSDISVIRQEASFMVTLKQNSTLLDIFKAYRDRIITLEEQNQNSQNTKSTELNSMKQVYISQQDKNGEIREKVR